MSALFRWPTHEQKRPELGEWRVVSRFLFLPRCLDGEWRWLGRERITQQCGKRWSHAPGGIGSFAYNGWIDRHWAKETA